MKSFIGAIAASLALLTTPIYAGVCATGTIELITEGGWGTDDLILRLDYGSNPPPTWWPSNESDPFDGYMRFRDTLSSDRLEGIRTLALLAAQNGNTVEIRTTQTNANGLDDCTRADEIKVFRLTPP